MGFFDGAASGLISGALGLLGGGVSAITGKQNADREYERQKEFAQNGIRWKVADAKAAGIHPLYAIGANTSTYSPQAAVGTDFGLAKAGQDIGRAIEAGQTRQERQEAQSIQNKYYEAQIKNVDAQTRQHEAQTDAIRQGIINDALYNNVDFISQSALASQDQVRTQQASTSFPTSKEVNSYEQALPGIKLYRVGDTYFEFPPEDVADLMENPKVLAMWKAAVETAYYMDGKVSKHVISKLSPEHVAGLKSGALDILRIPGIGVRVVTKEQKKVPAKQAALNLIRHSGGPYNIQ